MGSPFDERIETLEKKVEDLEARLKDLESRINSLENTIKNIYFSDIETLRGRVKALEERLETYFNTLRDEMNGLANILGKIHDLQLQSNKYLKTVKELSDNLKEFVDLIKESSKKKKRWFF